MFARAAFGSTSTSPPTPSFRSDIFGSTSTHGAAHMYATSPSAERHPDRNGALPALSASTSDPLALGFDSRTIPAVMIRKLPQHTGIDTLRSMLIFANDLLDVEFVRSPYQDDRGFATAVARFQSAQGAMDAQQKLHGKPNTTKEANMIVEAHTGTGPSAFERRNTIDGTASRTQTSSVSSAGSIGAPPVRSRFGSTFQPAEKVSPPLPTSSSGGNGEFPIPENSVHFQNLFSPQSPLANGIDGHHRVSGKSMINNDAVDDETGELLKDPVAYAKSGQQPVTRRSTNPQIPLTRFGSLSLSTPNGDDDGNSNNNMISPANGLTSPRGNPAQHSLSPVNQANVGPNGSFVPGYARPHYPPVNPADQNPPCNTLYVGNLPIDTSEDELKSLFCKQRGYKRLCFRTKHNGPMCFVEFEDVSFATKALHELYGHPLHNSVKGGIRLSFSKNPLGVRSGQTNGMGPSAVVSSQAMAPGYGVMANGGSFSAVSGPPPGLVGPTGLVNGTNFHSPQPAQLSATGMEGMFSNPFGMPPPPPEFVHQTNDVPRSNYSGGVPPKINGTYGRDFRAGYTGDMDPRNGYSDPRKSYNNNYF